MQKKRNRPVHCFIVTAVSSNGDALAQHTAWGREEVANKKKEFKSTYGRNITFIVWNETLQYPSN